MIDPKKAKDAAEIREEELDGVTGGAIPTIPSWLTTGYATVKDQTNPSGQQDDPPAVGRIPPSR